jgi:hypothetical protein
MEAFRKAVLKADRSQFEVLIAEQLSDGHSAGWVETTAQGINTATSRRSTWKFISLTDQTIQMVGHNAIVCHTFTGETARDGKTNPVKIGVLMFWHTPDGQ